jgi:hypothetical protein
MKNSNILVRTSAMRKMTMMKRKRRKRKLVKMRMVWRMEMVLKTKIIKSKRKSRMVR